jgi:hypothetical protein
MRKMFDLIGFGGKTALPSFFALTAACALSVSSAEAAVVATWDFTTTWSSGTTVNLGAASVGNGVSAGNLNGNITASGSSAIVRVATGGQSGAFMQFNPNTTGTGQPMNFILQLTANQALDAFTISYYASVSATTGSRVDTWAYSLNSGTTWVNFTTQPANATTAFAQYNVAPPSGVSVASGGTIWFRDTLTGATANNVNANFDTINVSALAVVPEPVTYALAVFGLVFVGGSAGRFYIGRRRLATVS